MDRVLTFFLSLLSDPALLIGLFALLGHLLQGSKSSDVISGTLKSILGFAIIGGGASILVGSLEIFGKLFHHAFNINGVIPHNEMVVSLVMEKYGRITALIMFFGMFANILFARFTPLKYIFLTGHHTLFMATLICLSISLTGWSDIVVVAVGSILLGATMVTMPALLQPFTKQVTGSDDFALGHFGTFGYLSSSLVAKFFGDKSKSTEDIKVPDSLLFLRDTTIALTLTMTILFIAVAFMAGPTYIETNLSAGQSFLLYCFKQSITFAAGVYVILQGVRMLIAEIVPAFKGISDKFVPNAKPAIDCPAIFPYAPNAVVIGFLSSFIAGLLMMFVTPIFGLSVIVPGLVAHFFTGATSGVYGNTMGGRRGAILGSFTNGMLISILPAILFKALNSIGITNTTFGDSDFSVVGILLTFIFGFIK